MTTLGQIGPRSGADLEHRARRYAAVAAALDHTHMQEGIPRPIGKLYEAEPLFGVVPFDYIVSYREEHGPFRTRAVLKKVPRLGPKAFELSAGFLRIRNGDDPLDASGVHPEAYLIVRRILAATESQLERLIGDAALLRQLEPEAFTDAVFGVPTVTDILRELEKPGRDPRPSYKTASFREGVEKLEDLKPGMILEGVVTNVAAFGAFVDVGVHEDGLVHISAMANADVKDPREIAQPGDVVRVEVL